MSSREAGIDSIRNQLDRTNRQLIAAVERCTELDAELGTAKEQTARWQAIVTDGDKRANRRTIALLGLITNWQADGNDDLCQCARDLAEILHVDPTTLESTI